MPTSGPTLNRETPDQSNKTSVRAKTYDTEFLALARLRGALLVTADARLRRGADRLGFAVDPVELEQLAECYE